MGIAQAVFDKLFFRVIVPTVLIVMFSVGFVLGAWIF